MKNLIWYTSATLLATLMSAGSSVRAEETKVEPNQGGSAPIISQEPSAVDLGSELSISPRYGIDFDTAGSGGESFGQVEGFFPLWQNAGQELLFFQGQLLVDTNANLGTNLQLGYRHYVPSSDRILGGYVAFDKRGTNAASFNQLGIGFETLGKNWDLHLNGFLPVGNRRTLVDSTTVDAGTQLSNLQFVGNQLIANAQKQQTAVNEFESALGGFDLELGTKLLDIGKTGALRGFAGLYYYNGQGVDGSLGWRVRLQAEPTDHLRTGLAIQDDDIFGTTVRFNIGVAFPRDRNASSDTENDSILARMGESINRNGHVVVDHQTEVGEVAAATEADTVAGPVTNPATGEPWFFNHVTPNGADGDGTFETPYNTIGEATDTIPTDGNGIIYVTNDGTAITEDLTIPGGAQLLSTGTAQFIAGFTDSNQIQLPSSGSGTLPVIQGSISLGSRANSTTVLAGFDVQNNAGVGITADNSLGDIVIQDNTVSATEADIQVTSTTATTAGSITISDNTLSSGIDASVTGSTLTGDITISGNTIGNQNNTAEQNDGIRVTLTETELTGNVTVTGNNVANAGVFAVGNASQIAGDVIISDNIIVGGSDSGDFGDVSAGFGGFGTTVTGNVVISDNAIETSETGILSFNSTATINGALTISNNTIAGETTETGAQGGILILNSQSTIGAGITLDGNTINARTVGIGLGNTGNSQIDGGVTVTNNPTIQVNSDGSESLDLATLLGDGLSFSESTVGILVSNFLGSTITDGVTINNNSNLQVAEVTAPNADPENSSLGILFLNLDGQVEGGVAVNNNSSINVVGANTDPNPTDPSDFGTAGIAVVNSASTGTSVINGGVTISGNTELDSSEYGIVVVNGALLVDGSDIEGDVTITTNTMIAVDDGILMLNLDGIDGSIDFSGNTITSIEDDGIDFSNGLVIIPGGVITGDLTFTDDGITAAGDNVKCTNVLPGTVAGTTSPVGVCTIVNPFAIP
ncbi:MAG: inverse autotransporter beta domain-containing protein [Cyanobacteria bacterium P01_D01_bin.56]